MIDFGFSSGGGSSSTETTKILIDKNGIINMNTTPVLLLDDPGIDKYYNILNIVLEYIPNTTGYLMPSQKPIRFIGCYDALVTYKLLTGTKSQYSLVNSNISTTGEFPYYQMTLPTQKALLLTTADSPSGGDGSLQAIITYEIRTFGT